ncbi:MAG TPA: amino acid adenylation domain-containing protein, partial [Pyrinomonadaceae bacterium]|nr:amino acid adenylation domain-containing protein [Pyrinomonadaceae bacterium]
MDTRNIEDIYPLSARQEHIFAQPMPAPDDEAAAAIELSGLRVAVYEDLEPETFAGAWRKVCERHAALRTRFVWKRVERPLQIVHREVKLPLEEHDWRACSTAERERLWQTLLSGERARRFNPAQAPLLRLTLCRTTERETRLLCSYSVLLLDDASVALLFDEVSATYAALREGRNPASEDGRAFEVYRRWLEQQDYAAAQAYWQQALATFPGATPLVANRAERTGEAMTATCSVHLELDATLAETLRAFVAQEGLAWETLLSSAWAFLLSYYSDRETVAFGLTTPVCADAHAREVSCHTLPLSTHVATCMSVRAWLKEQQAEHERRKPFAHASLALVRQWAGLPSCAPPFESRLDLRTHAESLSHEPDTGPLVIRVTNALTIQLSALFDTALLDEDAATRLLGHLRVVLAEFCRDAEQSLSSISPLTAEETRRLLTEWSGTRVAYPSERCIHQLFEAQAATTPDAPALLRGKERLSYRALNERANRLAHHLRALGVVAETPVALCCGRSIEMVVGVLGILKAGGAYVPLDPSYPLERLQFMLDDTRAPVLLTEERLIESLPAHWGQLICLDADWEEIESESAENPQNEASADNLAYVIYTSGSTGQPKGVAVTHRGVVRLVKGTDYVAWGADEVFLQAAPLTFDASTFEIWGSLLNGGQLALLESESATLDELRRAIEGYKVTTLWLTAGLFHLMADEEPESLREVRQLLAGGDVLSAEHVARVLQRMNGDGRLVNGYGPTESTTFTCCHTMTRDSRIGQSVSIGRPIANSEVYLVNSHMQPVPAGVSGELLIGGAGLARGYINRPELTAEKFIPHPFSAEAGARLYRTGDLARYLPDGRIEFLGRIDNQVKVRGFRIELGEIEAALAVHRAVRQCVVLARADAPGEKHLVAYVVPEDEQTLDAAEVRSYLRERLPEYMIPAQLVVLDAFPLTPNGKVDRRALPAPEEARAATDGDHYVAPTTAGEKTLAEIWQQVLGVERVGRDDNFFDLGGDSIRSIQIRAQAQKRGYNFTVQQVFQHQTIAELAREMTETDGAAARRTVSTKPFSLIAPEDKVRLPASVEDAYPLSMLQEGMLFHSELSEQAAVYHDIFSFHVRASLDIEALEQATRALAARHPVLRTSFALDGFREPLQLVHRDVSIPFVVTDLSELSAEEQERRLAAWMEDEKRRDFDWAQAPFIRFHIFPRSTEDFQFTLSFHHAIIDGWSLSAMLTELFKLYFKLRDGEALPEELSAPLAVTYRDFIALERQILQSEECDNYWTNKLASGNVTTLPPRDTPAPPAPQQQMTRVAFDAGAVEQMKSLARLAGVSLKNVLLAAHLKVFALLSGEREVVTGLVFNGRPEEIDGERVLGLFLNTLPFPLQLNGGTWVDLIQATAEAEREMMPFRRYPLAEVQRRVARQPLFEIAFNYNHFHVLQGAREVSDVEMLDGTGFTRTNIPFLAMFELNPHTAELNLLLEYNEARLSARQVEAIGNYYRRALESMTRDPFAAYERATLLSPEERRRVLVEWNETAKQYPTTQCLHQFFEQQAARTPKATALVFNQEHLTYQEVNERANQLAHHLQSYGISSENFVAILMERSSEMVISLLATLKAGAAYLPLDPSSPPERLAVMLSEAAAALILTQQHLTHRLPPTDAHILPLDTAWPTLSTYSTNNPAVVTRPDNAAYLIYTSGSTGRPKGVMNTHAGIVNRLLWMQQQYQLDSSDCVLQKTPSSFDVSVWEFFWPLMVGARLVLAAPDGHKDPAYLRRLINDEAVTTVHFVPSMLQVFVESGELAQCQTLRRVICSGEALSKELAERCLRDASAELHNLYGPTEAAVDVTFWHCQREEERNSVPIGRPIANTQIYILDREMQVVPQGVSGELYIGGVGLARGYVKRPELTAERFVPDPYSEVGGARLYRTGDVARYLAGGEIEYLGRVDYQVKVRGYRIELGEIEAALVGEEGIGEAVVIAVEGAGGDKQLVAYLVAEKGAGRGEIETEQIRRRLEERLPDYMVPAFFVELQALPLTPNGKVDRRALPEPERGRRQTEAGRERRASTPVEEVLAGVWSEVLGLAEVGVEDNFFEL